eukprot:g12624.t1
MLSSADEQFATENTRGIPIRRYVDRKRDNRYPPSHPAATAEVGQLLDLGLALGHERFELVSLVGREEAGVIAAHAWASCGDNNSNSSRARRDSGRTTRMHLDDMSPSRPRPSASNHHARAQAGREELRREVEWLKERVENLSRELMLARKDSTRLATQLKQEEEVGREQRRKADDAVHEAKALRKELNRLKEHRKVDGAAARAALSDAQSRSVRMAERRRRQQAESLMHAYKGLYEDQLQTQHASSKSYRSLTRGYSRLSADNKALRRETAVVAAVAAAAGDAAGNAAALIASSAEMQRTATLARSGKEKERREQGQGNSLGGSAVGVDGGAAARSAGNTVTPVGDDSRGDVTTRAYAVTAAESAAAVATAASAVAAAAGALAEATTSGLPADGLESMAPVPPSTEIGDRESAGVGAIAAAAERDGWKGRFERGDSATAKGSSRDRVAASRHGSTRTKRPSTAETIACSPYSEKADTPPPTAMREELAPATAGKSCGTAGTEAGGTAFVDAQAPPADCSLARQKEARTSARAKGEDDRDIGRIAKSFAFSQTTEDEDEGFSSSTDIHASSSAAAAPAPATETAGSPKPQDSNHQPRRSRGSSTPMPEEPDIRSTYRSEPGAPRLTKAIPLPPVEPAPRWRGRSAGPGRLLATPASWAENVDVEAPKRSSSPVPPRRGRWGDCSSAWGSGDGGARADGCSRIEPSSRVRPHSI